MQNANMQLVTWLWWSFCLYHQELVVYTTPDFTMNTTTWPPPPGPYQLLTSINPSRVRSSLGIYLSLTAPLSVVVLTNQEWRSPSHSKYEIWNIVGCVNQFAIALVLQCIVIHCQYTSSVSKHHHIALQKSSTRTTGTFRWTVRRCRCKKEVGTQYCYYIFFLVYMCLSLNVNHLLSYN